MTDYIQESPPARLNHEVSTGELVKRASEQVSRLVRNEVKLAQMEIAAKAKHAGVGAGMFGGAAALSFYGGGALIAAAVLALALVLPGWLSALLVAVGLFLVAGILALIGRGQMRRATPPVPERVSRDLRADIDTVTQAVKERGNR